MVIKACRTSTAFQKFWVASSASIMAFGLGASAVASGSVSVGYNSGYYDHGYYGAGYYSGYDDYYGHGRRRHYGHGGGGKAAAIALGVIGGAIIINELAEDKARRRAYENRTYTRYDRYSARATPLDAGYAGQERLPKESYGGAGDEGLGRRLDGGPEPIRISFSGAYETCLIHARAALADRDFTLIAPERPDTADDIGGAWKMTANVTTQGREGKSWTRAMYCEADEARVYLLELL